MATLCAIVATLAWQKILLPPANEHPQGRYQVFVQELMQDLSVLHQADVQLKVQVSVPQVLVTSLCVCTTSRAH